MKTTITLLFILLLVACSTKNSEKAGENSREWKEMASFHMIMAEAFHPYKDSANLTPAKEMANELADGARVWSIAELPEKVRTDEMKLKMQMLSVQSQSFLALVVENASDSLIGKSLTDLHTTFHEIQEGWYKGAEKKEEHDHH